MPDGRDGKRIDSEDCRLFLTRHPQFDAAALHAQTRLADIQGGGGKLWFAGAWTGWGFHEDGIASAVRVVRGLGLSPPWAAMPDRIAA